MNEQKAARKAGVEVFIDSHYDCGCDGALELDWLADHTESARTLIESLLTLNPQIANGLAATPSPAIPEREDFLRQRATEIAAFEAKDEADADRLMVEAEQAADVLDPPAIPEADERDSESRIGHNHGDQECDPSEEAAMRQFEAEAMLAADIAGALPKSLYTEVRAHKIEGFSRAMADALYDKGYRRRAAIPEAGLDRERLAEIVSDSLAATTEGTDWAEAPEPSDEPGSPYVLRLTNEITARLRAEPAEKGAPE